MRIFQKTSYDDDINLFKDRHQAFWYGLLVFLAVALPFALDAYRLGEVTLVLIWAVAGMGLMVLAGHTGQASLGHAAFLACGAYMEAWLNNAGVPFLVSFPAAGLFAGAVGAAIAIPAIRMSGIYLAIATLAMGIVAEDAIVLLADYTGGVGGTTVGAIAIPGVAIDRFATPRAFYWLCLAVAVVVALAYRNLLRSATGRAFVAIRDSEVSAKAMGINIARYKTLAFFISCAITGLAGALFGHYLGAFNYEAFLITVSIQMLLMIVVGGMGSIHGAFFGAMVVGFLPQFITAARQQITLHAVPGLDTGIFAMLLIAMIVVEPLGLYGQWVKTRIWLELFPLARRDLFRRQRSYLKTERLK
jgi:branched-chain amino acid transport system permease protein